MKINKEIRKKAIKRIIARYKKLQSEVTPYGFNADNGMKYYCLIDYWEDRLLKTKEDGRLAKKSK